MSSNNHTVFKVIVCWLMFEILYQLDKIKDILLVMGGHS